MFELVPRRVYFRPCDLGLHGFWSGCKGCVAILGGGGRTESRSEECRRRRSGMNTSAAREGFAKAEKRAETFFKWVGDHLEEQQAR